MDTLTGMIHVIDDDPSFRKGLERLLRAHGLQVEAFASAEEFKARGDPRQPGCIILDINLGGREIRLLHAGRAVTPGDAFMYLPKERVVVTGDLLVNPISFALSSYPSEWLKALEAIDALDTVAIVPGHGEPLRDKTLLHATMDVFRTLLKEGKAARERGLDVDHAVDAVMPSLKSLGY